MRIIKLNKIECEIVLAIAHDRQIRNVEAGVKDKRYSQGSDPRALHVRGFGGEMAFAKLANLYPDFTTDPRRGGHDFILAKRKIDVKTTSDATPMLSVATWKKDEDIDYYVLMNGDLPEFEFIGWAYRSEILRTANVIGVCYVLKEMQLNRDLEEFNHR